jgi:TPR repeat protein
VVPPGKCALLVGVRDYDSAKLSPLRFTENDVEELARVLDNPETGFSQVRLLTSTRGKTRVEDTPTAKNIRAAVKSLLGKRKRDDMVLLALAGHGLSFKDAKTGKDESFFCPSDAQVNDRSSMIGFSDLFGQFEGSDAGVKLLLVDACRNDPKLGRSLDADTIRPPRGTAALFSCSTGERAFESARLGKGHGVFFHFLLEGLKGKAENEEKVVTWERLAEHVTTQVPRAIPELIGQGARQTPHLVTNRTGTPPVLLQVSKADQLFRQAQEAGKANDLVKAARDSREAAEAGHPLAWGFFGLLHVHGEGVLRNDDKARELCRRAAPRVREAAAKGQPPAQFVLGAMYQGGLVVEKNDREAVRWYRPAAEKGHALAQNNLGDMYAKGKGVEKNDREALRWYRLAAEQGHVAAQYSLGWMYANGRGGDQDEIEAVKWYRQAAAKGHTQAQYHLGVMYTKGQGVPKDESAAVRWFHSAAAKGHALAQNALGEMYAGGHGVPTDVSEAARWVRKAAAQDLAQAQHNLGVMYATGQGVARDLREAVKWYRKAAGQGLAKAQNALGLMCTAGRGVAKDEREAVKWFRKAAKAGDPPAQYNLGWMYSNGWGVVKNEQEALGWIQKAADQGDTRARLWLKERSKR